MPNGTTVQAWPSAKEQVAPRRWAFYLLKMLLAPWLCSSAEQSA